MSTLAPTVVGIGELVVTTAAEATVVALGLGSCVAVTAYAERPRVAAMIHVMLPAAPGGGAEVAAKYADTGVAALLGALRARGAVLAQTQFTVAGGAQVLRTLSGGDGLRVGERNAEAVLEALRTAGARVRGTDLGGTRGRTVELQAGTGLVQVRTLGGGVRVL